MDLCAITVFPTLKRPVFHPHKKKKLENLHVFEKNYVPLHPLTKTAPFSIRDVAQLVAHYVRDVGVGRSSRLIPTKKGQITRFVIRISGQRGPLIVF